MHNSNQRNSQQNHLFSSQNLFFIFLLVFSVRGNVRTYHTELYPIPSLEYWTKGENVRGNKKHLSVWPFLNAIKIKESSRVRQIKIEAIRMKERPNGSWIVNHQTNDVIRRRFCRWKNTKRRIYFEGTLFRIEGIAVKGVDWYWIPVLLQLVIVAVTIGYISVYRFVYYHLTGFFSVRLPTIPSHKRHYSQPAKGIEKYSIAKLRFRRLHFYRF